MDKVRQYIDHILQRSYLTKGEKRQYAEEMESHLDCSIQQSVEQGFCREEAIDRSIKQFGSPEELNDRLTQETFGFSGKLIRLVAIGLFLSLIFSLIGGPILSQFSIHNRYIELLPAVCIVMLLLCLSLLLTRKYADRLCLVSVPLLFVCGYLQAYFQYFIVTFGSGSEFTIFQVLFFSGEYDTREGINDLNFQRILVGSLFLAVQSFIIYAISRNRNIALLPFGLSIVLTLTHMATFRLYALIGSSIPSPVYYGYERFLSGEPVRLVDMALKLCTALLLFALFRWLEIYASHRKQRTVQ